MKKIIVAVFIILIVFSFSGCGISLITKRDIGPSDIFTKKDISNAMNAVENKFFFYFDGCVLLKLSYSADSEKEAEEWAKQYDKDEAIVLYSDFFAYADNDGSLKKGEKYSNWSWVLVRDKGQRWELKNWGYA